MEQDKIRISVIVRRMSYTLFCHSEERSDEESLMSTLIVAYAGSNSLRSVGILRCAQNDKTVHDHVDHYNKIRISLAIQPANKKAPNNKALFC